MNLVIRKDFIRNGGKTTNLDTNKDGFQEYTLNQTKSGYSFEIFDFNSDGKKDMDLYYDENGDFVGGNFYVYRYVWEKEAEIVSAYAYYRFGWSCISRRGG